MSTVTEDLASRGLIPACCVILGKSLLFSGPVSLLYMEGSF